MELEAIRTSYARWAPVYDNTFGFLTTIGRRRAAAFINRLGGEVLEVGVGTGLSLGCYSDPLRVTGIDYSTEMLTKAREKVAQKKLGHVAALIRMDARNLDFPDGHFDTVTAMHVLSVVPDPERVVAEMARVCKPGGRIVIVNHFACDSGVLGALERMFSRYANRLGWHSDFEMSRVLGAPGTSIEKQSKLPPLGMMTFLCLRKDG
ncbi:MAG: class I SAM-dependent methyltransferase [Rhodobacteraceae bacterium]|jgi:phosphatidylethanolamine/phosphatidyl-N-methylethanolamine N-methyltransferase|nr:class I SAM-dependent methyltransferase [Paracoccaceae bacterium]